jgi:double-stranded uracil-DNA glycosylase
LILGSLPGAASLAAGRYYAHPRNQFWRLLDGVFELDLDRISYEERLALLLRNGIGLWDVIAEAERVGSLDTAIRNEAANDLANLIETLPELRTIAFNGGTAAKIGVAALGTHTARFRLLHLPSSSPTHARPFDAKLQAWQQLAG